MFQAQSTGRKSLSLSVRISLWLIGVAILPLLVALVINELIPPGDLQRIALGQQFISGVYYDPTTHQSTVELYTPIYSTTLKRVLGVVRDTMSLAVITSIVNGENGANGSGSYAFILDQNGVRIIDPHPKVLFTSIAPLSPLAQQQVQEQNLYGSSGNLPVLADTTLQGIQSQQKP